MEIPSLQKALTGYKLWRGYGFESLTPFLVLEYDEKPMQNAAGICASARGGILVNQIRAAHPDADIVFMTPTYFGSTGTSLDMYAKKMTELGEKLHIGVIDLHKLWMDHWIEGAEHYGQGDWLTTDDCHPSDIGHKAMAEEMMRCFFETK